MNVRLLRVGLWRFSLLGREGVGGGEEERRADGFREGSVES